MDRITSSARLYAADCAANMRIMFGTDPEGALWLTDPANYLPIRKTRTVVDEGPVWDDVFVLTVRLRDGQCTDVAWTETHANAEHILETRLAALAGVAA